LVWTKKPLAAFAVTSAFVISTVSCSGTVPIFTP